jgi:hypothetical protein
MNCLTDYVGLRGCGDTTPPSGLYVNDLPGISNEILVKLTNQENATYVDVWNMIQQRAGLRFSLDVREAMGKHYKLNSLMQGINVGNDVGGIATTVPASAEYVGFSIELIDANYEYVPSPLASIHIQQIVFYADQTYTPAQFRVIDIDTNETLGIYSQDVSMGKNIIEINTTFHNLYINPSWRLGVVVNVNSVTNLLDLILPYSRSMMSCCDLRLQGYSLDIDTNVSSFGSNTYGMSGIFSVVCNWDALICQNKILFSRAWWYLLGIEMLTELLYSNKLNQYTTVNLQRMDALRAEYQVEYNKTLTQVAGGFKLSCDCCIECNEPVQLREATQFY